MAEVLHYLHAYTDEVMPCLPTLEAWAAWLSQPDPDWGRALPAQDGEEFEGHTTLVQDVVARRTADGWTLNPPPPATASWFVLRHGPGLGWDSENMAGDALSVLAACDGAGPEYVSCMTDSAPVRYRFRSTGPQLLLLEPVQ